MTSRCKYATFRIAHAPSEDVPLGARSVGQHTVPAHWIDNSFRLGHVIFLWGIKGTGLLELEGCGKELGPETIGVLFPGQVQRIRALDEEWEYCWWTLDGPLVEEIVSGFGFESRIYQAGPAPLLLIKQLVSVIERPGRLHELEASGIAYELLCQAARYSRPQRKRQIEDPLVNAAVDVILRLWQDGDFGVEALADSLDTHRSSLSRRFKKATGNTLIEYINALRMHQAAHLLRHSEAGIAEIAHQCGFKDANYFSKQFKTRFGNSPSRVRKRRSEG